jgi:hypothetical protein
MPMAVSAFETVAREHLKMLENAGGTPSDIVIELANVARSYASEGLSDEAAALLQVVHEYQYQHFGDNQFPSGGSAKA